MRKGLMGLSLVVAMLASQISALAWDDTGHMVVAYVAYGRLTPAAKARVDRLLIPPPPQGPYPDRGFVYFCTRNYDPMMIANWMDDLRDDSLHDPLKAWHFINYKPIFDGIPSKNIEPGVPNVLERVKWVIAMLEAGKDFDKTPSRSDDKENAEYLGYLVHLVGDMHQPLHCTTRYSAKFPDGDAGGNLFKIDMLPSAGNLHSFWDAAGGLFGFEKVKRPPLVKIEETKQRIEGFASLVTKAFPANPESAWKVMDPDRWAEESNDLARKYGFKGIKEEQKPTPSYIARAKKVSSMRLAFAGYRLAEILNRIYQ